MYVVLSLVLSALYFAGLFLVLKTMPGDEPSWGLTGLIILFAVIFRLCLVPSEPSVLSKDMYRYVWDGRVQQTGINPYLYPPDSGELKPLRDNRIYPNINRKNHPTIYPAAAQLFFRAAHALVGDSVTGYKGIMAFFDFMTLVVLTALLRTYGLNPSRVIVYAWNPLVIFEIAYSGHLEGLMIFLTVIALYMYATRSKWLGVAMLAASAAVKLYPALLMAALPNRGDRVKDTLVLLTTLVLLYLPFTGAGVNISGFLPVYLENPYESFNLGLKPLLMHLIPGLDYHLGSRLFIIILSISGLVIFFREKEGIDRLRCAYILSGLLLILMPASLHPWYVILIIPFLSFFPNPAWLLFSCTVSLSYLKYASAQGIMPQWVLMAEYLPLFTLLAAGFILKSYSLRKKAAANSGGKQD